MYLLLCAPAMEMDDGWMRNWAPLAVDYGKYDPLRAGSIDGTDTTPHDRAVIRAMKAKCEIIKFSLLVQ